ncbi:relaxase/mobilization nuclease domain-containing protein [Streptomyces sp. NBC_01768]|uniref:relaxase/mobilization nuclease domain-containing protein n=1 Tax=Streptomyces sp. NBC_01768 TaxID=2975938 RepID=UPI002DD8C081|nr:mobilization protein [Streptomyces sp. NBC_01768]WSC29641.1 relaxase/mobilization nuclease domain-containing protein [Streptomyces sp. NBC_01768]
MIANIVKPGRKTRGVLNYLYGPGRTNEHADPHLVASFDGFAPDPGRDPDATLAELAAVLDLRVMQAGERAPKEHVWHCSIRAAPEDRPLSDEEWATIARRVLNATGIAPAADPDACRWIAVRHANDHIHIVATKVRGDLRPPRNWNDYLHADNELVAIEKEYGLRQVPRGDRTAAKRSTRAEQEKAHRTGRPQTARERLRITARTALAAATTPEEFFTFLEGSGVLVEIQRFPSGDIRGYKTALDGDTNKDGRPVWFSGSTLAPDLSYPKISERLASAETSSAIPPEPDAWRRLAKATDRVPDLLASCDDRTGQAHIAVLAETLDALPLVAPADVRPQLMRAAGAFERAGRSRIRAHHQQAHATRNAVKAILREPSPKDGAALAILLDALLLAVIAARHWHQTHHHDQQAEAAREAAEHLRAAYQAATIQPIAVIHQRGRHLARFLQEQQATVARRALPDLAEQILGEPGWPALAATLAATKKAGHDPAALLTQAARHRELDTATSYSEVLTWRLNRLAELPQPTPNAPTDPPAPARTIHPAQQRRRR